MMFKICVIGCGEIAKGFHGPALKKYCADYPGAVLTACCDSDAGKAKAFAASFGFSASYSDYREMVDEQRPDAVCLIASYSVIPAIAIDVMRMGYPVIMEKPPGINGEVVSRIIDAANESGVPNQVAFNRRHAPVIGELKNMLTAYPAGEGIHNIRCVFQRVGRTDNDFFTTAIHGIDTVRYIAGSDYKHVRFRYQELPEINKGAVNIYMDCVMASGAAAQLAFCPSGGKVIEDYHVACHNNEFTLKMPVWGSPEYPGGLAHFSGNECVKYIEGSDPRFGEEMFEKFGFYSENADFFNTVRANKIPANDIKTALQSVEIAYCIQERRAEYLAG
ncbi:MAG: Gfo/Idh/MocA family oxidoreductase [Defluviitaleaceae bacterium]|nr:Gfo/Idh/MocA family oxidoreductase [Defluviitaleaceae bacterium]